MVNGKKITLNQIKTEFMLIGSRQRMNTFQSTPLLAINNVPVKEVCHTKSLGILNDENLYWNVHIEKLTKNVASILVHLNALGLMFLFPQCNHLQLLSSTIFRPLLSGIVSVVFWRGNCKNYKIVLPGY